MNDYYTCLMKEVIKQDIQQYFDTFEKNDEITEIIKKVIDEYFNTTEITFEEEISRYGVKENKTHIYRDRVNYDGKKNKCLARIWNCGMGGQCSFTAKENGFCKKHAVGYGWWLGTINEPRPERPMNHKGKVHVWLN